MSAGFTSASLLESLTAINAATDALVAKVMRMQEPREAVVKWLRADIELFEQIRDEFRNAPELAAPDHDGPCESDPLLSALDAAIAMKCVALAALNEHADRCSVTQ